MTDWGAALAVGVMFGLTAGMAPGPLMTLVITHTLQHGAREGLLIAAAPLVTDIPIILLSLFVLGQFAHSQTALAIIGICGGTYIVYLALETMKTAPPGHGTAEPAPNSLKKGAIVNALNPHPYLFWATVGAPFVIKSGAEHSAAPWAFIGGFYVLLVGSKIALALLVGRYRTVLVGSIYPYVMRALGLLLMVFAWLLFRDALRMFGVL